MRTLPQLLPHRTGGLADHPASGMASRAGAAGAGTALATVGPGTVRAWGGRAVVRADDAAALPPALRLARHHLRAVARACDLRSPSAQVHRLAAAAGEPVPAGPLLLRSVRAALETAADTHGLVDPTTSALRGPADRPGSLPVCGRPREAHPARGWRCVRVSDRDVQVPGGTALDLTATALPMALDDLALVVGQLTGTGVRVALHGRLAGCDADGRRYGTAVTDGRRVVDPRTGRPADAHWASVHVVAGSARSATALALAAVLHGGDAPRWLAGRSLAEPLAARLVAPDGEVVVAADPATGSGGLVGLLDAELEGGGLTDPALPSQRPLPDGPPSGVPDASAAPAAVRTSASWVA